MRGLVLIVLAAGTCATALFATLPVVGTRSRAWRLAPFVGPADADLARPGGGTGDLVVALSAVGVTVAGWADRAVGALAPITVRLTRVHAHDDASLFRFRQGALFLTGGTIAAVAVIGLAPPPLLGLVALLGLPAAAAAGPELALARRGSRWSATVRHELPVVGEQLVALLRAGRSPVVALEQVAAPDGSPIRRDIARVVAAVHRGAGLEAALSDWSAVSDVDGVHRLVSVLSLHHRTPDLAQLVRAEVDATRAELHRDLLARIDRRAQQVWIPVTVAALVPGAIFLLIPFFDALRLFGATA